MSGSGPLVGKREDQTPSVGPCFKGEPFAMFTNKLHPQVATLFAVCIIGLSSLAARQAFADNKDDEKILGTWTVVSIEEGGKKAPEELIKDATVTFTADGKMTTKRGEQEQEFTYRLDPTQKIKEFNGTNAAGKTVSGIYKFDGDTLTVCFDRAGGRPTEFASPDGTVIVLYALKREKK
jgi:uncharacterized protein (TIGR03067 family)